MVISKYDCVRLVSEAALKTSAHLKMAQLFICVPGRFYGVYLLWCHLDLVGPFFTNHKCLMTHLREQGKFTDCDINLIFFFFLSVGAHIQLKLFPPHFFFWGGGGGGGGGHEGIWEHEVACWTCNFVYF